MVRTFRDLQNDEDRDDDHADQDPQQDFFAGGEKSGLAVQDPNRRPQDHFRNILNQAREYDVLSIRSVNSANYDQESRTSC
jgi:UBX domain-containing protein 1